MDVTFTRPAEHSGSDALSLVPNTARKSTTIAVDDHREQEHGSMLLPGSPVVPVVCGKSALLY